MLKISEADQARSRSDHITLRTHCNLLCVRPPRSTLFHFKHLLLAQAAAAMPGKTRKRSPLKNPGPTYVHSSSFASTHAVGHADRPYIALGLEGSANKLGAGIIKHAPDGSTVVLSNVRHTYITPPGEGFLPRDTAKHHRDWALTVINDALQKAGVSLHDIDCICFTKGT